MRLYLDTSAMVSLFIREERTESVQSLVDEAIEPIGISDLTIGEFSAAMFTSVRTGRLTGEQAMATLERADLWATMTAARIDLTSADMRLATKHVRRADLGLLFPDALHLALCDRAKGALVTGDRRQLAAAKQLGLSTVDV